MSYLSNFKNCDPGQGIEPISSTSALIDELCRWAYGLCKTDATINPQLSELEHLIEFMVTELERAGEHGAEWFRTSINNSSVGDNEYTRRFCTADGYIEMEGAVNVLLDWSLASHEEASPDWTNSPDYAKGLHARFRPALMMGAFALYKLNSLVAGKNSISENPIPAMNELAIVVDAIAGGEFNSGWAACEQMAEDLKKENGKAGAKVRNEKFSQTREWVIDQYKVGSWPSPRAASLAIAPKAIEFAKSIGTTLSVERAQTTVYEWLLKESRSAGT